MNELYKLLVVDDERIIREGLLSFQWEKYGFIAAGSASDGEEALELLGNKKIDLVITDIKMSIINGLELSEQISKLYPNCKVIILSGYKEFDYAEKAIRAGVLGYLLKPIDFEELGNTILRARTELDQSKEISNRINNYEKHIKGSRHHSIEIFLDEIVHEKRIDEFEIQEKMSILEVYMERNYYTCVVYKPEIGRNKEYSKTQYMKMLSSISNTISEYMSNSNLGYCFMDHNLEVIALFNFNLLDKSSSTFDYISGIVAETSIFIKNIMTQYDQQPVLMGVGGIYDNVLYLSASYKQACKALELSFFDEQSIIFYSWKERLVYANLILDYPFEEENRLIYAVLDGKTEQVELCLKSFWEVVNPILMQIEPIRFKNMVIQFFSMLERRLNMHGASIEEIYKIVPPFSNYVEAISTITDLRIEMENLLRKTAEFVCNMNNKSRSTSHNAIQQALKYILENYTKRITLSDIAGIVYLNPSYFSVQFKKETGKNFVEYIKELRVEKAKTMLKRVELKAYEVSELVGYQDYKYFTEIFKKITGFSPVEYRQKLITR